MPSFSASIPAGGTHVIEDYVDSPLKLALRGDRQPFAVDIESKPRGRDQPFKRIPPLQRYGPRNVRVTREKVYETREIDDDATVRITLSNNAGEDMTVHGYYNSEGVDEYFSEDGHTYDDARYFGSVAVATREADERLFDTVNRLLKDVGEGGTVWVEPGNYTAANDSPVIGTLRSQFPDQRINFFDATIEAADGESGSMVSIEHDGLKLVNVDLNGNRSNTTVETCITTDPGLSNVRLDEIEVAQAPTGIEVNNPDDAILTAVRGAESNANLDVPVHINGGRGVELTNAVIPLYNDTAVRVEDATGVLASNMALGEAEDGSGTAALHVRGVDSSRFTGLVDAAGSVTDGILDEAYDPGGPDEKVSSGNRFEMDVNGAMERGVHVSDAEVERIDVNVNGEYDGGRTTQVFEFDYPDGLVDNPAHQADIDGQLCTRWTDTTIDSANAGATINGHITKLQESCDFQLNGRSIVNVTFGVALPSPVANAGADTTVRYQSSAKRVKTDNNGQVNVDWSDYYHLTEKPVLNVSLEDSGRQWYVSSYGTDGSGRYTDATVQVTDSAGTAVAQNVDVNVKVLGT